MEKHNLSVVAFFSRHVPFMIYGFGKKIHFLNE